MFPDWTHPIVGPIVTYPNKKHLNACFEESKSIIEARLENAKRTRNDPDFKWEAPVGCSIHTRTAIALKYEHVE